MTPTAKALAERARELCDAATPGPWVTRYVPHGSHGGGDDWHVDSDAPGMGCVTCGLTDNTTQSKADAEFIAASRALVPALLAEVERLQKLCEEACGIGEHVTRIARSHGSVIETARLAAIRAAVGGSE
jgi:hypothetical protein